MESDYWTAMPLFHEEDGMGRRGYPAEFRQRVFELTASGRRVADVARDLGVSDQTVCDWRRQDRADRASSLTAKRCCERHCSQWKPRLDGLDEVPSIRRAPWRAGCAYREAPRGLPPARSARFVR